VVGDDQTVTLRVRRTIICRQFNLNATHDGNWCAVLDVVVRGMLVAVVVMSRGGLHFTGLLEDTCPDVVRVDVKLLFVRFLEARGVLGPRKRGSCTRRTQATDKPTNSSYVD
jgi:hypothetical protein